MGLPVLSIRPRHLKSLYYGVLYTSVVIVTLLNMGGSVYLFFSPAGVLWRALLDYLSAFPPAKWLLYLILVLVYFGMLSFLMFQAAARLELAMLKPDITLRDTLITLNVVFAPWLDVLKNIRAGGWPQVHLERIILFYVGAGLIAATLSFIWSLDEGDGFRIKLGVVLLLLFALGFGVFYAGLWVSGGMGDTRSAVVWHVIMAITGHGAYLDTKRANEAEGDFTVETADEDSPEGDE